MMRMYIIYFGFLSMLANALYIPDRSTTNAELNYRNMNITDFNFALVEVENLSSETLYINLEGNDLTSMPDNIAMYFSQMERIILNDNLRLSFPPDGSPFLRSPSLIELICERCGIYKIFTRSLRHLPHLEYLWLSDNQINQIAPYAFRRNQRLQNVDLSFNKLYTVPADMLKGLFRMKVLDLSNNPNLGLKNDAHFLASNVLRVLKCNYCGFTELYEETFSDLTNLKELHLEGNPILAIPYLRVPVVLIIRRGLQSSSDKNELYNSSGYRYSDWWWNGTVVYV
ncbi:hypothetical protein RP20_CCG012899 [Aedes albopictus]|nr:hypothetical protein RP20_CCG012899 [Aedes albopictus]